MFVKTINTDNRKEMIDFLENHFRYPTMNSWNRSTSYANNVKIHNLDIPSELKDKAWDFINAECPEFMDDYYELKTDFENDTGFTVGTNGRSGGYIVMYDMGYEERNGKRELHVYIGRSVDQNEDFDEWDDENLVARTALVTRFDKFCDDVRDLFIDYLRNTEIKTVEYFTKHEKLVAEIPE